MDCLILQEGVDKLSLKVGNKHPPNAVHDTRSAKVSTALRQRPKISY
jgi:hypothetical protein